MVLLETPVRTRIHEQTPGETEIAIDRQRKPELGGLRPEKAPAKTVAGGNIVRADAAILEAAEIGATKIEIIEDRLLMLDRDEIVVASPLRDPPAITEKPVKRYVVGGISAQPDEV